METGDDVLNYRLSLALGVLSYIWTEFFSSFYFPQTHHLGWTAGLTRRSSLLAFSLVGVEVLTAVFILLFAIQRLFTAKMVGKSN